MSYNVQNQKLGIAFQKQSALQTISDAADFWLLSKTNSGFGKFGLSFEDDGADVGKGSEFPTQLFPVSKDVSLSVEKRLSSEWAAWLFAFGLGTANMTTAAEGTTGTKYTIIPTDVCDGLDLPAFSVVEQLGAGCAGGDGVNRAAVGCVVNDFNINFTSGPGRNNTMSTVNIVGSGKTAEPSGITLPASALSEHLLSGSSATVTINGTDYVSNKSLLSLQMGFANNVRLDSGYFIGSGTEDGAAIRGRMERGNRAVTLSFTARLEAGSAEHTKLKAQTSGTAAVVLTGASFETTHNHKLTVTYHKVQYAAVDLAEDNAIVTVAVTLTALEHPTNGVVTAEIITTTPAIGS
jgi:hypothetical protein